MELKDTIEMMMSEDYKERFKAEYNQTKIRYEKLKKFNTRIEAAVRTDYKPEGVRVPMPKHTRMNNTAEVGEYLSESPNWSAIRRERFMPSFL